MFVQGVRLRSKLRTGEREVEGLKAQILRTQPEVVQLQDQMQASLLVFVPAHRSLLFHPILICQILLTWQKMVMIK